MSHVPPLGVRLPGVKGCMLVVDDAGVERARRWPSRVCRGGVPEPRSLQAFLHQPQALTAVKVSDIWQRMPNVRARDYVLQQRLAD
jgi:hypothetical protein